MLSRGRWFNPAWSAGILTVRVDVAGNCHFRHEFSICGGNHASVNHFRTRAQQGGARNQEQVAPLLQKCSSPIKLAVLAKWLWHYSNKEAVSYLLEAFGFGFRIPVTGKRLVARAKINK